MRQVRKHPLSAIQRTCKTVTLNMKVFSGLLSFLFGITAALAEEPVSIAGRIHHPPAWTNQYVYAVRSQETERDIAALSDPRSLILQEQGGIVQGIATGATYEGLPVIEVLDLLPERWSQPSIAIGHYTKGFGAFSGYGREMQSKDYARSPFSFDRAYPTDMSSGLEQYITSTSLPPPPPVWLLPPLINSNNVQLRWAASAGVRYDLQRTANIDLPFQSFTSVVVSASEQVSINLPRQTNNLYFRLLIQP